jgi:hypothetical protein
MSRDVSSLALCNFAEPIVIRLRVHVCKTLANTEGYAQIFYRGMQGRRFVAALFSSVGNISY